MKPTPRPPDAAPGGMGGIQRMPDPTEREHDRIRRRIMNIAFGILLIAGILSSMHRELRIWDGVSGLLVFVAGIPLGLGIKIIELRFKMAGDEWYRVLRDIPFGRRTELLATGGLVLATLIWLPGAWVAMLTGAWAYDFVTYYHDRPQRLRHLYNVVMILDELRGFPRPWLWPLPAWLWGLWWSFRGF